MSGRGCNVLPRKEKTPLAQDLAPKCVGRTG
ncbi:Gfo/Idh/MocA family oxidoreductase [Vibrio phage vB_VpS_PG28]|nr:Gfo/Idh/MocA family oxidoreductase [Vibrio phage vB_VpS_PG28]